MEPIIVMLSGSPDPGQLQVPAPTLVLTDAGAQIKAAIMALEFFVDGAGMLKVRGDLEDYDAAVTYDEVYSLTTKAIRVRCDGATASFTPAEFRDALINTSVLIDTGTVIVGQSVLIDLGDGNQLVRVGLVGLPPTLSALVYLNGVLAEEDSDHVFITVVPGGEFAITAQTVIGESEALSELSAASIMELALADALATKTVVVE